MSTPARICVIRQGYYPLDPRVRREVVALLHAGHEVEVICLRRPDEPRVQREGSLTVRRVGLASHRAGPLRYLLQYAAFFVVAACMVTALHLRRRFDLVQVCSMPDALAFAAVVPRVLGARLLLDLHECMPEFYAAKFGTDLRHPWVRVIAWFEQASIRFSDQAITCTDQMRDAFESRGAPRSGLHVLVNSADEAEFDPGLEPVRPADTGEFRVVCHGTVEKIYGIDIAVRAVALLRDEIPGLRLKVYGEGSALAGLRKLISELRVDDMVTLVGRFVPLDELVAAISTADAGIVAVRRDVHRDLTHCNKMFDFIAMRKPAIVSRTPAVDAYFDDSCLQKFEAGDAGDLARAIRELHSDAGLRERLVERAARTAERYSWPRQRHRYLEIVERLVSASDRAYVPVVTVAWDRRQARTEAIAAALGGRAWFLRSRPTPGFALPIRYVRDGVRMWRLLRRHRPRVLIAVTPPVIPPLLAGWWCTKHSCQLVVDCHTGAFHSWKWRWTVAWLRRACRSAAVTLVHTAEDEALVRSWSAAALLLPDDVPTRAQAEPQPRAARPVVVVAGSLDGNEPVEMALAAARLLPEVEVRFTGDPRRVAAGARRGAPGNVVFTGWLDYPRFLGELLTADVVAVFSTDPFIMNRAAFEAVGLGRPLVLSELAGLRARFGEAAVFTANEPQQMADAIRYALGMKDDLASHSEQLQDRLREQHDRALEVLRARLAGSASRLPQPGRRVGAALDRELTR